MNDSMRSRVRKQVVGFVLALGWVLFLIQLFIHGSTGISYWWVGLVAFLYMVSVVYWLSLVRK